MKYFNRSLLNPELCFLNFENSECFPLGFSAYILVKESTSWHYQNWILLDSPPYIYIGTGWEIN